MSVCYVLAQTSRPGPGASSPQLVPGTWQVHVDQQGLGGSALSHRRQEAGRWEVGGYERGDASGFALQGTRSPPEATAGDREKKRREVQQGLAGGGCPGMAGDGGGPGAKLPATRLLGTLRPPARAGAAISVLIKAQPPQPPGPRPRPSYRPIAIKSPTRGAAARRTRQPPAPHSRETSGGWAWASRRDRGRERVSFPPP